MESEFQDKITKIVTPTGKILYVYTDINGAFLSFGTRKEAIESYKLSKLAVPTFPPVGFKKKRSFAEVFSDRNYLIVSDSGFLYKFKENPVEVSFIVKSIP